MQMIMLMTMQMMQRRVGSVAFSFLSPPLPSPPPENMQMWCRYANEVVTGVSVAAPYLFIWMGGGN